MRESLDALQLAAVPGGGGGGGPELMRWLAPDPRPTPPSPAGSSSASTRRSCTRRSPSARASPPDAPGPTRHRHGQNPYSQAGRRHPGGDPGPRADALVEHRRLPEDARHARHAAPPTGGRLRPGRQRPALRPEASHGSRGRPGSTRGGPWTGSIAGTGRVQRALEFVEFLESQEAFLVEAQNSLFGFRRRIRSARQGLVRLGVAVLAVGALLYVVLAYPSETRGGHPPRDAVLLGPRRPARGPAGAHRRAHPPRPRVGPRGLVPLASRMVSDAPGAARCASEGGPA